MVKNEKVAVKKDKVVTLERERHLTGDKEKILEAGSPYDSTPNNKKWSSQEGECEVGSQLEEEVEDVGKGHNRALQQSTAHLHHTCFVMLLTEDQSSS